MTRNTIPQETSLIHLFAFATFLSLVLVCLLVISPQEANAQSQSATQSASMTGNLASAANSKSIVADSTKITRPSPDRRNMVLVEGGTFQMGSKINGPIHAVKTPSFYMDKYEVTVAEFKKFCKATGGSMPPAPPWGWKDNQPVVNVTWKDAVDYAAWVGKRLPTEAEWEFAARGGIHSKEFRFSGSNSLGEVAWYAENSSKTTHAVGTKASNELGLFDMSGNASEWCLDWYDGNYYRSSPVENPDGPDRGMDRVVRGGSFNGDDFDCRATFRHSALPVRQLFHLGFRCASSK